MTMIQNIQTEALQAEVEAKLEELRVVMEDEHGDPRQMFNDVQELVTKLEVAAMHVPDELREFVADLEAEVVEDFYDNLPV